MNYDVFQLWLVSMIAGLSGYVCAYVYWEWKECRDD